MDKIAAALRRNLNTEAQEENPFWLLDEAPSESPAPVRVPRSIDHTDSHVVEIPRHVLERHRVAVVANDASADAFRTLRTQLLLEFRKNRWQTLAVTSPNKGAGKSTVALNLAISFAMEVDHTALLVDADLRDPDLRNILELPSGPGLADYLVGDASSGTCWSTPDRQSCATARRDTGGKHLGADALADDGELGARVERPISGADYRL
jgi:hypothetical protein